MAIEKTYLLGKNITLGCGFDLQAKAPLDPRQVVPEYDGLQALIDGNAAYEGMIVYDEGTKKTYQAQLVDGVLAFREFGINEAELKALIASETTAAMEFKGAATALPENPSKGDFYKVTTSFDVADGETAKIGDSIVYDGEQWFIIPSGDDIEDTWRPVTGVDNDATLTFEAGDKLEKTVAADGTITYKHVSIDAPTATHVGEDEQTRTYIASIETDGHGHITGYKTATENVEDTNTEYTFEGQSDEATSVYFQVTSNEEGTSAEVIYLDAYSKNEADGKFVAKETGKSLVSDDEIARLAEVDNYDDEEVRGLIGDNAKAIEDLEAYVGTVPTDDKYKDLSVVAYINKKAEETLAAAQGGSSETAASVKQQLDNYKSENDTRVKAVEDDIDAINNADTGILKQAKDYADGLAGNYDEKGAAAGVQTALEAEIAKKVAKTDYESDKATFATKTDIAKLAGVSEGANKVEASANNGSIKIDGVETVVYTHPDNHSIDDVTGLQDALDAKVAKADYEVDKATFATKTELGNVDKKLGNYTTTTAQQAIDAEQDRRLGVIEGDYLKAADIADFETKENVKKVADDLAAEVKARGEADTALEERIADLESNFGDGEGTVEAQIEAAVAAEKQRAEGIEGGLRTDVDAVTGRMNTAEEKITAIETESAKHAIKTEVEGALALKADKSVVDAMYTNDQIDGFIAEAKKYADDNDADTKYGIVYDSDNKKIKLVEGGTDVEIDATAFIKDGMIESVALSDDGLNLVITWNTDSDKGENNVTTIPLTGLVDVYTGVDGARIKVAVSSDKKVGADLVAGSISKDYLDDGVKASLALADSALQSHQNISHLATKAELEGVDGKFANYTTTTDMNAKFDLKADKSQVATDIADAVKAETDRATGVENGLDGRIKNLEDNKAGYATTGEVATAKGEAITAAETKAGELDAALKTELQKEIDDDVKALADTVCTKTEIEALLTWGSF